MLKHNKLCMQTMIKQTHFPSFALPLILFSERYYAHKFIISPKHDRVTVRVFDHSPAKVGRVHQKQNHFCTVVLTTYLQEKN